VVRKCPPIGRSRSSRAGSKLVVEIDGFAFHGSRHAFERDRRRDADLVAAGYRVVRFTWRQIKHEPEAVVARLAVLLHASPQDISTEIDVLFAA
jgi:very-short-patch-repair endonuclease